MIDLIVTSSIRKIASRFFSSGESQRLDQSLNEGSTSLQPSARLRPDVLEKTKQLDRIYTVCFFLLLLLFPFFISFFFRDFPHLTRKQVDSSAPFPAISSNNIFLLSLLFYFFVCPLTLSVFSSRFFFRTSFLNSCCLKFRIVCYFLLYLTFLVYTIACPRGV